MTKILTPFVILALCMSVSFAEEEKPIRPALIVIDLQNDFRKYMDESDLKSAKTYINYALDIFHKKELPVFVVEHTDKWTGEPEPGSEGFQTISELELRDSDARITKNYGNSFRETDLGTRLKELNVNTVFLCGFAADGCVISTYHGAVDRDLNTFLIENALVSSDHKKTTGIQNIFNSVPIQAVYLMTR